MAQKCKAHTENVPLKKSRFLPPIHLLDLPLEILDTVLAYALPDLRDLRWTFDVTSLHQLYDHPILRTSRFLRQRGLAVIQARAIWIHVAYPDHSSFAGFAWRTQDLVAVPERYNHLITKESACIEIDVFNDISSNKKVRALPQEKSITKSFPYNLDILAQLCQALSPHQGYPNPRTSVSVRLCNMVGSFDGEAQTFILPSLLNLHSQPSITLEFNAGKYMVLYLGQQACSEKRGGIERRKVDEMIDAARQILAQADRMQKSGYIDEGHILLWSGMWLIIVCDEMMLSPGYWQLEGSDIVEEVSGTEPGLMLVDRVSSNNRLRSLLHRIQYQARLAYAHLHARHGAEWCDRHELLLERRVRWLTYEPQFSSIGLSTRELAEMHYGRALLFATRHMKKKVKSNRGKPVQTTELTLWSQAICLSELEQASSDAHFACLLDPGNHDHQALLTKYEKRISVSRAKSIRGSVHRRFVLIRDMTPNKGGGRVVWAGDRRVLMQYGGSRAALEWLPIAQRGLDISPTVEEWVHDAVPTKLQHMFLKNGDELVEWERMNPDL